jgi:hypothetical protein
MQCFWMKADAPGGRGEAARAGVIANKQAAAKMTGTLA